MTIRNPIIFSCSVLITVATFVLQENSQNCTSTGWNFDDKSCPDGYNEIYNEVAQGYDQSRRICCYPDTEAEISSKREAPNCRATECLSSTFSDLCSTLYERYIDENKLEYEEIMRDPCTRDGGGGQGVIALCCQPDSSEGLLITTMGAEPNEFPHQAKLKLPGAYGGTVYNKRFIVTAAHCIVDEGEVGDPSEMKVILGTNIADVDTEDYVYNVTRAIPHEEYSKLANHTEFSKPKNGRTFNDIGLLELDRDIVFGDNIKALEIAPKGFDPFKNADQSVIVGWGTTDTLALSIHLQKANFILRKDTSCFAKRNGKWKQFNGMESQLLCVGGVMEGKWSPTAGGGDSGGPAICRKQDGHPVLCGVTSFGGDDEDCVKNGVEANCLPSVYAEVAHFHDWIKKHAGSQDTKTLYQPHLYGQKVPKGQYEHQVPITSKTGKPCGGTLVSPDIVVTAGQCVMRPDGKKSQAGLKVTTGINDLVTGKGNGKQIGVKGIVQLPGFKMDGEPVNVERQGNRVVMTDNYFLHDLAVIKLDGKAAINKNKLPALPNFGDRYYGGVELAFPRNTTRSGQLMSREFKLPDLSECQTRMDRMSKAKVNIKVEKNILCGVEKYSGGSTCDRELGGGLICKGRNGKDVLCGVEIFRLCSLTLPNGFMNMGLYGNWVTEAMKKLSNP